MQFIKPAKGNLQYRQLFLFYMYIVVWGHCLTKLTSFSRMYDTGFKELVRRGSISGLSILEVLNGVGPCPHVGVVKAVTVRLSGGSGDVDDDDD